MESSKPLLLERKPSEMEEDAVPDTGADAVQEEVREMGELEAVLSDGSLSRWRRFQKGMAIELKILFRQAGPGVIVYLLNNVTSISTC